MESNADVLPERPPLILDGLNGDTRMKPRRCSSSLCEEPKVDGHYAWILSVTSFAIILVIDGITLNYGILYPNLLGAFPGERVVLSMGASMIMGCYLIASPVVGVLAEKFGFRVTAIAGSVLAAVGFIGSSFAREVGLFVFLHSVLTGLGASLIYTSLLIAMSMYFDRWRSLASGIAHCGGGVGTFIFPLLINKLISVTSWRRCIQIEASLLLLVFFLAFLYKTPPVYRRDSDRTTAQAFKTVFNGKLLRNKLFLLAIFAAGLSQVGLAFAISFLFDKSLEKGIHEQNATWTVSIFGIANTAGRIAAGLIGNNKAVSPLLLLAISEAVAAALTFAEVWFTTFPLMGLYSATLGLQFAFEATFVPVVATLVVGIENISGGIGFNLLARGVALVGSVPLGGYLRELTGDYKAASFFAGACCTTAALLTGSIWLLLRKMPQDMHTEYSQIYGIHRADNSACVDGSHDQPHASDVCNDVTRM